MYFKQFYLGCLSHASYLVGDESTGTAVVVDPQRDIEVYLEEAAQQGLRIERVILTHFHADFVAGHIELRERTGAEILLGAEARAEYTFTPLPDGTRITLGNLRLEVLATPGHTPEGISIVVYDLERDADRPHGVLTGDTLFVGDVGRPDLMASVGVTAAELAERLYDSLHEKLLTLPDETRVYPAHGAGSLCGKKLGDENSSTIGHQRRLNYALQPMTKAEFVALVTADLPVAPAYFGYDAQLNREEHATLGDVLEWELVPLKIERVLALQEEGAQLLDVREPAAYAAGFLAGSVQIGLDGSFATWAGTILDRTRPIVLIAPPDKEREAVLRLGRIGFDQVVGFLEGGLEALVAGPDHVQRIERIEPRELERTLERTSAQVIDVRTAGEWEADHIEGSRNLPLQELSSRMAELPLGSPLVLYCESGYRSAIAASLLAKHGLARPIDLAGGFQRWRETRAQSTNA